jgi:hypothetical protein
VLNIVEMIASTVSWAASPVPAARLGRAVVRV